VPPGYAALHLVLGAGAVGLAAAIGWGRPRAARATAGAIVVVLFPLQLAVVRWPGPLANAVGWADLVFFAELYVQLAAALAVAGVLGQRPGSAARWRTGALGVALVVLAASATRWSGGAPPRFRTAWVDDDGVVRQTDASSCAAAAAATLLRRLEVDSQASEARLAALCLTDPGAGTRDLGLFRGLRLAAPGRSVRFGRADLAGLEGREAPCILFVGLERANAPSEALFRVLWEQGGWTPGEYHAVVWLGFDRGRAREEDRVAVIADPRSGLERWGLSHFRVLWQGRYVEVR